MSGAKSALKLEGQTFTRLTVLRRGDTRNERVFWVCRCSCGNEVSVSGSSLKSGHTQSCGCLVKDKLTEVNKRHRTSAGKKTTRVSQTQQVIDSIFDRYKAAHEPSDERRIRVVHGRQY